jgi:hypothetical protein
MIKTRVMNIIQTVKSSLNKYNESFIKRRNKDQTKQINLADLVYASALLLNKSSYSVSNSLLQTDIKKNVSNQAINQRRKNMDISLLESLNSDLLANAYDMRKKIKNVVKRLIAVDGFELIWIRI